MSNLNNNKEYHMVEEDTRLTSEKYPELFNKNLPITSFCPVTKTDNDLFIEKKKSEAIRLNRNNNNHLFHLFDKMYLNCTNDEKISMKYR